MVSIRRISKPQRPSTKQSPAPEMKGDHDRTPPGATAGTLVYRGPRNIPIDAVRTAAPPPDGAAGRAPADRHGGDRRVRVGGRPHGGTRTAHNERAPARGGDRVSG